MLDIKIDMSDVERQVSMFSATIKEIDLARTRALRKTLMGMRTQVKRNVAKDLKITQKVIKDRFKTTRVKPGAEEAELWVGTYNVPAHFLGKPRQLKSGVRVGRRSYRGAFMVNSSNPKFVQHYGGRIWMRKSSRHYSPALYPGKKGGSNPARRKSIGGGRFPIVQAAVRIHESVGKTMDLLRPQVPALFAKKFDQEMNYVLNVNKRR